MPGARCTHSPACEVGSAHGSSPQVHRDHPAFPHAMVLTAYFVLSPVTGLFCHRRQRILAVSVRSDRHASANLTPASGRQDHTTSPSAAIVSRQRAVDRSRIHRIRPATFSRAKRCRVHRIPPRVRDDRDTPLCGVGCESSRCDLGWTETEIFLQSGLDTPVNKPPDGQISKYVGWVEPTGPVEDRTRWLNPSCALIIRACLLRLVRCPLRQRQRTAAQRNDAMC